MKKNVIVVMLDSLGANYVGCYGNKWIKTPNLDRLAREGVLFENNYIEGLPTVPCRRSMHTGRYHLHDKGWSALDMDDTTIADLCWGRPIDTALVFDCPMYRLPKFGYTRGFDKVHYIHGHENDHEYFGQDTQYHLKPEDFVEDHILETVDRVMGERVVGPLLYEMACHLKETQYWKSEEDQMAPRVMKRAVKYLEEVDRNKQFFLWVDCFDPHEPWDPPSVYDPDLKCLYDPDYKGKDMFLPVQGQVEGIFTEPELHHIRMLHAEKVTMVDRWLGYLMDKVRALGLEEDTLFLMVSDHGEPLGNGEHGHGLMRKVRPWPYEELVHAPIIMRGPGLPAGKRVKGFTQSCDVAPTVTDWLGIGVHPEHTGKSLLPLARGEVDKLRDFAIAGYFKYSASIITEDWSFIHWLRPDEKTIADAKFGIYRRGILKSAGHLSRVLGESISDMERRAKEVATLDGEDQWTCTPGSIAEVPERDQLFDRREDRYQLNNIAAKDPGRASELYAQLREFMAELRTS
ncbi:MAG: sulfatase [Dehalococcoidales bacterium]|nr:sulfatase [Dehalococcoidales bacterium]